MSTIKRAILGLVLVLGLMACTPEIVQPTATLSPDQPVSPDAPATRPAGEDQITEDGMSYRQATVDSIDILLLESFPLQVNVVAKGNLRDGCTEIDRVDQVRTGDAFQVTIITRRPADALCAAMLTPFEEVISLEVAGLPAGTYTVDVNGVKDSFELTMDNALPKEPPTGKVVTKEARVDEVGLLVSGNQLQVIAWGNLPDGCTEIDTITQQRDGRTIRITVMTARPADAMCITMLVPFEQAIPLDLAGLEAGSYTVIVNGISQTFELPLSQDETRCPVAGEGQFLYQSDAGGYCLLVPADFQIEEFATGMVGFYGPPLDQSVEPVAAGLTVEVLPAEPGRTLDEVVAEVVNNETGNLEGWVTVRTSTTLGGEPAVVIDGMPGRTMSRQLFALHGGLFYRLVFYPVDEGFPQAAPDVDRIWQAVQETFTFTR